MRLGARGGNGGGLDDDDHDNRNSVIHDDMVRMINDTGMILDDVNAYDDNTLTGTNSHVMIQISARVTLNDAAAAVCVATRHQ